MTISPLLLRLDHATLSIDGAVAEREVRDLLADLPCGRSLGKRLYLDFTAGKIELSGGFKGPFSLTLVTVSSVVIDGSTITFPLQPGSIPFFDAGLKQLAKKLPSFVRIVTGEKPALVIDLSLLPEGLSVTVKSIAFVPGAAVVTLGPSGVGFPRR